MSYLKRIGAPITLLLLAYFIDPFNTAYLFGYGLAAVIFLNQKFLIKNIKLDFILLALFTFTYAIFYTFSLDLGTQYIFIYALVPLAFYLTGKFFVAKANTTKDLFMLCIAAGVIFSTIALISVLLDINQNGFVSLERGVPMIWGGTPPAATVMATYFLFNMCIPAILISRFKGMHIITKIFLFIIFLLSVYCVLRIGSRTQLAIAVFTTIASLLFIISKQSAKRNMTIFFVLFIGINLGLRYFSIDKKSDLLTSFASRMDSKTNGAGTAGGRTERWEKSINNLIEKPFGWEVKDFGYSHNLWLDVARVSGIIPFILLLIFSIRSIRNTKKAISRNPKNVALNNLIIAFSLALFLQFSVEPIFEGIFNLFLFYCLFQGIINGYLGLSPSTSANLKTAVIHN